MQKTQTKKIEKLLEMSRKITFDELIMLSDIEEQKVNEILLELKKENLIRIEQDMIFYLGSFKSKTNEIENKKQKQRVKEEIAYENWDKDEIPLWARKRFLIYKKMFNDAKELEKSNKLKLFIEKYSKANNIDILTQSNFIEMKELFFEKGEDYFLKNIVLKPLHGHEIINKVYSNYKDAYLNISRPEPKNALSIAKKNFLKLYPEYSRITFAPPTEFTKRLQKEYTQSEIKYYRHSIVFDKKNIKGRIEKQKNYGRPIICEFEKQPQIIKCLLSDLIYDLQSILINKPDFYSCNKVVQGKKYKFKSNNESEISKEFNPDKLLDYLVILSYIQSQKREINGFILSSINEIRFFRGKSFKNKTTLNKGSTCKYSIVNELKVLSNIYFLNKDKYEPIIEIKKIDDKNLHQEFNFYFKINPIALTEEHFIHTNLLYLNPTYYLKAKRLGYYLDLRWQKKDFLKPICIKDLMESVDKKFFQVKNKVECKKRTELIWEILKGSGIINNWYYYDLQSDKKRNWLEIWLNSRIIIEPNLLISNSYSGNEDIINFNTKQLSEFISTLGLSQKKVIKESPLTTNVLVKINKNEPISRKNLLKVKAYCELKESLNDRA